jgi:hypothetical protein
LIATLETGKAAAEVVEEGVADPAADKIVRRMMIMVKRSSSMQCVQLPGM